MRITAEQIYIGAPHAAPDIVSGIVAGWSIAEANGVVSGRETAFFLGHAATETAGFTRLEENLYYTTTTRLKVVWPSRFKTDAAAKPYVKNPRALANLVYGGRMGNEEDGTGDDDGWNYRGSGLFQTTGRDNFARVEKETGIGCLEHPDLLRIMPQALEAAAIYWRVHKLGALLDKSDAVAATTRAIQGGTGGLSDRMLYIGRYLRVFASPTPVTRMGSRGKHVETLQEALRDLGFYDGEIDGVFGGGTDNAVREFQETHDIRPVDGVVGSVTWAAINEGKKA